MRGAQIAAILAQEPRRIIPTDAGSTFPRVAIPVDVEDHPRGCGEHNQQADSRHDTGGSSPRMRGAQDSVKRLLESVRIIPADAGSTRKSPDLYSLREDHPRGCGEHSVAGGLCNPL